MTARGLSLVEIVVALVLVSLAWGAVTGLHLLSVRMTREAALREEIRWTVQAVADSVDRRGGTAGRTDRAWGWVEWRGEGPGRRYEGWTHEHGRVAVLWSGTPSP